MENPALSRFLALLQPDCALAQVLVTRTPPGFSLRHLDDRLSDPENLRLLSLDQLRTLVQSTSAGAFRPLKSAPNLSPGWRHEADGPGDLASALNEIYPNALADWFAATEPHPPVTGYRAFTARQSGMYRITTFLDDTQAATVIRACCHRKFCLKQRMWTVAGLEPDRAVEKSIIPCLEPCAVLLEFARQAVRLEQAEKSGAEDVEDSGGPVREADFSSPGNPRRQQWVLEKLALKNRETHVYP